jgi:ATP-dependent Clp protease adaptor protein ClpS
LSTTDTTREAVVAPLTRPTEETKARQVPPYNVILENDDYHSFEFVIDVLCKALGVTKERSYQLTLEAHHSGRAVVWTSPKEVAELKVEQIRTFHENHRVSGAALGPLSCRIEPAPS